MAKSAPSNTPDPLPGLKVSREHASKALNEQASVGSDIRDRGIHTASNLDAARAARKTWVEYVTLMLRKFFTSDQFAREFERSSRGSRRINPTHNERVQYFRDDMQASINQIGSILARMTLLDDPPNPRIEVTLGTDRLASGWELDDAASEATSLNPALERLNALIAEGKAIRATIDVLPGKWHENPFTRQSTQGPTQYRVQDWQRFSKWRTDVATVLGVVVPGQHELSNLGPAMRSIEVRTDTVEWAIAQLESVRDSCIAGLFIVPSAGPAPLARIIHLLSRFHLIAKQLEHRHGARQTLVISDEFDVQDLLHALLRSDFDDVREEEATPSVAGKAARMDLVLKSEKIVIEAKMTRDRLGDKEVGDQLLLDIARYGSRQDCEVLICFVYDPGHRVRNRHGLINDLQQRSTARLKVVVHISPP